jgi:4'-phosphopantetheinyl transferase
MSISDPAFQLESPLALPESEVHLWRLDLEALAAGEDHWHKLLSADEQDRARRFLVPRVREHFLATRGMLRSILGGYLEVDPRTVLFQYSAKSKPSLAPAHSATGISFNVDHSGGVALLAFCRNREIGVDVERMRRDLDVETLAHRFFSPAEQKQLAATARDENSGGTSNADKFEAFFRCWTRKEAFIKAKGEGLWLPLDQFDVSVSAGAENALLATRPDEAEASRWSLREIEVPPGYVAALCVAGHDFRVRDCDGAAPM